MNIFNMKTLKSLLQKLFLPWVALYVLIIGGAALWVSVVYESNNKYRLPSGEVGLSVSKTQYQLGETIEFNVTNHFPVPIFVINNCPKEPLDVYQWKNETWIQLHDVAKEESECYSQERNVEIPSEGTRGYNFNDWPNLFNKPGVYRIATKIEHSNDIPFQDFVILEPAKVMELKNENTPLGIEPTVTPPPTEEPRKNTFFEDGDDEDDEEDDDD